MRNPQASTTQRFWVVATIAIVFSLGVGAGSAWAQTNREINGAIQFNFAPPGARSLAMGGAFIGRADDATAAYTNPAGLIWLTRPEIALEGRQTTFETVYQNGRLDGDPTGQGRDTVSGLYDVTKETDVTNLSFVSLAFPMGTNYRLAFYRHELANLKAAIDKNQRAFYRSAVSALDPAVDDPTARPAGLDSSIDLEVIDYGVSTAFRLTENFWAGVGFIYRDFMLDSLASGYFPRDEQGTMFGDIQFTQDNQSSFTTQRGDDSGYSFTVGLFLKSPNDKWSGGISYQHSTEFDYALNTSIRREGDPLCTQDGCPEPRPDLSSPPLGTFTIPKNMGLGISYSPGSSWMISLQYNRITYSDLEPDLNALGEVDGTYIKLEDFEVDDVNEIHLGIEYVILGNTPIALRVGAWYDPDHQLHYVEANRPVSGQSDQLQAAIADNRSRLQIRFPGGDDQVHYTGGIGAVFAENTFQLEFGFDVADLSTIYSLSGVLRF
jgi:long-subunit fatty acid transport protein